jgi:biotin carboxyl carrier protein
MPGKIVRVLATVGQEVGAEQGLIVMEAMKMENELRAPRAGRVHAINVVEGQAVETGAVLVLLD